MFQDGVFMFIYNYSIMSIVLTAEFKVEVDRILECWPNLYCTKHALVMGVWRHAPRKVFKIYTTEIESGSMQFDEKYKALKLMVGGKLPHPPPWISSWLASSNFPLHVM